MEMYQIFFFGFRPEIAHFRIEREGERFWLNYDHKKKNKLKNKRSTAHALWNSKQREHDEQKEADKHKNNMGEYPQ